MVHFFSEEDLRNKYGIVTHFWEYYYLRSDIPGYWKQQIRIDNIKIPEEVPVVYINYIPYSIVNISWSEVFDIPCLTGQYF